MSGLIKNSRAGVAPAPQCAWNRSVLVVDDDRAVRESVAEAVASTGRPVFTVGDGSEALSKLEANEIPRPCLILLDWMMRPMNGQEFLTRLRSRPDVAQLPVLVMSANSMVGANAMPGVLGTLRKPFE